MFLDDRVMLSWARRGLHAEGVQRSEAAEALREDR